MSDNTAEEEKVTVSKKELQNIIDERVERKLKEERSPDRKNKDKGKEISRRNFLKKLGVGTAGLGALSLVPGSALNVRSDGFSFYGGSGSGLDFDVDNSGNVEIPNGRLVFDSSHFDNKIELYKGGNEKIGTRSGEMVFQASSYSFFDTDASTAKLQMDSNNNVKIPNGNIYSQGNKVWHAGNDGSGSGLDADTLDGQEASELGGNIVRRGKTGDAYVKNTNSYVVQNLGEDLNMSVSDGTSTKRYLTDLTGSNVYGYLQNFSDAGGSTYQAAAIKKNGSNLTKSKKDTQEVKISTYTNLNTNDTFTFKFGTYSNYGAENVDSAIATLKTGQISFTTSLSTSRDVAWATVTSNSLNKNGYPKIGGDKAKSSNWLFTSLQTGDTIDLYDVSFSNNSSRRDSLDLKLYEGSFV